MLAGYRTYFSLHLYCHCLEWICKNIKRLYQNLQERNNILLSVLLENSYKKVFVFLQVLSAIIDKLFSTIDSLESCLVVAIFRLYLPPLDKGLSLKI